MTDDAAQARAIFCRHLRDLHDAAGTPSREVLLREMRRLDPPLTSVPGRSSIGNLLTERFVRTPPWILVEAFVRACAACPTGQVSSRDIDLDRWRELHGRLAAVLAGARPASASAGRIYPTNGRRRTVNGRVQTRRGASRYRWEVALSFAGEERSYVEQVAAALKQSGVRCFYDADEQIDLWGKYLAEELPAVYGGEAATVVVFVSAAYALRDWTRLERRVALNRAARERRECVLPARFDDTPLPGLLSDMVAIDLRNRKPKDFAVLVTAKLAALGVRL
jgi:hypothetical protein